MFIVDMASSPEVRYEKLIIKGFLSLYWECRSLLMVCLEMHAIRNTVKVMNIIELPVTVNPLFSSLRVLIYFQHIKFEGVLMREGGIRMWINHNRSAYMKCYHRDYITNTIYHLLNWWFGIKREGGRNDFLPGKKGGLLESGVL